MIITGFAWVVLLAARLLRQQQPAAKDMNASGVLPSALTPAPASEYDSRRTWDSSLGGTAAAGVTAIVQRSQASGREWVDDMLELQGLTRRYGDLVALDDLSFTVAEDQMFGFVGPNGAGKTTAMRIILGVLAPDAGEVRWRGQPMNDEIRKHIGYLPEDHGQTFPPTVRY
jgi:ABC-type molybdenum transport system ATPase subunit/photorepair protein PhrA